MCMLPVSAVRLKLEHRQHSTFPAQEAKPGVNEGSRVNPGSLFWLKKHDQEGLKLDEKFSYGDLAFEWNSEKAALNIAKHGVSFEEAASTWDDETAVTRNDFPHSWDEERFLRLGFSSMANLLLVVHCLHDAQGAIRIISARKATRREEALYAEFGRMA